MICQIYSATLFDGSTQFCFAHNEKLLDISKTRQFNCPSTLLFHMF